MIRDQQGLSRGCAFLKFAERAAAVRAIEQVHQKVSLIVSTSFTLAERRGCSLDEHALPAWQRLLL